MKKILTYSLVLLLFVQCKKKEVEPLITTENPEADITIHNHSCYLYDANGNKIELHLDETEVAVKGKLNYALFEKDKNEGTIEGIRRGDTLIATYTFLSEGFESKREVAFLFKDNQLIEGYGEIIVDGYSAKFKDQKSIQFTSTMPLSKTACE